MKSLRAQLILSHVLPQLIILPLLVISLGYIIESQVLLVDLANNFRRVAMLAAQEAAARPAIWQDTSQAEDFARFFSESQQLEIILLRPDGEIQAAPSGEAGQISRLSPEDLAAQLAGETLVKSMTAEAYISECLTESSEMPLRTPLTVGFCMSPNDLFSDFTISFSTSICFFRNSVNSSFCGNAVLSLV